MDAAIDESREVLKSDPTSGTALHWLGKALISEQRYPAAIALAATVGLFSRNGALAVAATQPKASETTRQLRFSQFFEVANESALTAPMIYGGVEHDTYIVESVGGGCAFFD